MDREEVLDSGRRECQGRGLRCLLGSWVSVSIHGSFVYVVVVLDEDTEPKSRPSLGKGRGLRP